MKKESSIRINKKYLVFRQDAEKISNIIEKKAKNQRSKDFCLDFSEVRFFSRSFVDELLNVIDNCKKKKIAIRPINLDVNLKKLLNKVKERKKEIKKMV